MAWPFKKKIQPSTVKHVDSRFTIKNFKKELKWRKRISLNIYKDVYNRKKNIIRYEF